MAQFRAKARAVDLLGKGQIADLPTAISELWKNGYDAYGDNLKASLYLKGYKKDTNPIFVLSDDGKGMNREDILEKWFVLGTDSKSRYDIDEKGEDTLDKEPRVKMGEKGIGRLAVAYLGPQMLMLTKKKNHPLEIVFFDWRILENFEMFLSDVNIPVRSINEISEFSKVFEELKSEFLGNFPDIKPGQKDPWKDQLEEKTIIINDCKQLSVPDFIIEQNLPKLSEGTHGTTFIIFQPDEQIIELHSFSKKDEEKDEREDESGKHTINALAGLFNPFKSDIQPPNTSFWIKNESEGDYNILDYAAFFLPEDFESGDHLIDGEFDELGSFKGIVRIYNKTIIHTFTPLKDKGKKTNYGTFKIKLGIISGIIDESILNEEQHRYFRSKLELFSGLYIYRDGFRVLPYGRSDNDFLGFEERRGKHAGIHFFAKRRMFGYLEIERKTNPKLKDKSSREGFITNAASRDFRRDLIAFFNDLSKKYFGTKAENDFKEVQKNELVRKSQAQKDEYENDKKARKAFANSLKTLPNGLEDLQSKYIAKITLLEAKKKESDIAYKDLELLLADIEKLKVEIDNYKLSIPVRFSPTELQKKNYHAYNKQYNSVIKFFQDSEKTISEVREKLAVHEQFKEFENKGQLFQNTIASHFADFESRLSSVFYKIRNDFDHERSVFVDDFRQKYNAVIPNKTNSQEITRSLVLLENIFAETRSRMNERVVPYIDHLNRISLDVDEDSLVGFYKTKFEEMKEEWNKTYELAQLGIAVEIIDHQFNTLYSQLSESIKSMKEYLQPGKIPETKYGNLSVAFDHLQDNYKLLQPLYRTTGRISNTITGVELKEYAEEFFKSRFMEGNINYDLTKEAENWSIDSYESIFKPVVINIINNALYWLKGTNDKRILIDSKDGKLLILNSGEPIDDYSLNDIFKLFVSNRPNGRGIGLYLAKQSLNGIGYEIEATNDPKYNTLNGACFSIYKT